MEPRRIITSNVGRAACAKRPTLLSAMASCCLEGPRGFPGEQGKDGEPGKDGESGAGTLENPSGIIPPFVPPLLVPVTFFLGQGSTLTTSSSSVLVNGFSVPIPLDGNVSNFVVSVAQQTKLAYPITYAFEIYRIKSSLGGTVEPVAVPMIVAGTTLQLMFPATSSSDQLQASIENIAFNARVYTGDRLGVSVLVTPSGALEIPISPTFNASFSYSYL